MTSILFKRLVAAIAALAVVGTGVLSYASPYIVLNNLKHAADARDAETVNRYVDYPALRASLKHQISARIASAVGAHANDSPLTQAIAGVGTIIGSALIAPIVDVYATPDGVAALLAGMPPRNVANDVTPPGPIRVPPRSSSSRGASQAGTHPAFALDEAPESSAGYQGVNEFVVRYRRDPKDIPYTVIFHRTGIFGWQLVGIELNGS